jgi:hypothetical protein
VVAAAVARVRSGLVQLSPYDMQTVAWALSSKKLRSLYALQTERLNASSHRTSEQNLGQAVVMSAGLLRRAAISFMSVRLSVRIEQLGFH